MNNPQSFDLHNVRVQTGVLGTHLVRDLGLAPTGLTTIGELLHLNHIDGTERLSDGEVEGLLLAVCALGDYVQKLSGDIESTSGLILSCLGDGEGGGS